MFCIIQMEINPIIYFLYQCKKGGENYRYT